MREPVGLCLQLREGGTDRTRPPRRGDRAGRRRVGGDAQSARGPRRCEERAVGGFWWSSRPERGIGIEVVKNGVCGGRVTEVRLCAQDKHERKR
jgi:hypothetical protein